MSETRSVTLEVAVTHGGVVVPVRRWMGISAVRSGEDRWVVGTDSASSRFTSIVQGFDAALDLAERMAVGMERVRLLRELAQEAEDRLHAETILGHTPDA